MAKQPDTKTKAGSSPTKYKCPKCSTGTLAKDGKTPAGKQRWTCNIYEGRQRVVCYNTTNPEGRATGPSGSPDNKPKNFRRPLGDIKRFIITSAQNATPVHEGFFEALKGYCKENDAELIVIPTRYKNPTSRWTESQKNEDIWLVPDEYLYNQRKKLCANLILLGDIKVRPTAEQPLTGFEGITHGESGILGHSKVQLRTIPTPQSRVAKILTTTGSCTIKNYTDSKAGKKGEFHHTIGACVVDIEGRSFHLRQVTALNDGSFIDLDKEYFANGNCRPAPPALGLIMGDTHARFADPAVIAATFGKGGIVDTVDPEFLVWHDLLDGYAVNPHHKDNPFIALAKFRAGFDDIKEEIEETVKFLEAHTSARKSIVVASNHDDFFNRWIRNTDWRKSPVNAEFYLETAKIMAESVKMTSAGAEWVDPFSHWIVQLKKKGDIRCLKPDESFSLGSFECGFHGHRGPSGTRGTIRNLARLGVRVISGHGHSPALEEGHTRVGTSTGLKLEYTEGPSSWMNTHCVVYGNGCRSLINIIDGEWRF